MHAKLVGMTMLLIIWGNFEIDQVEAGRRSRCWHRCATVYSTQHTPCATPPATSCAPQPSVSSTLYAPNRFCQTSEDPVFSIGGIPFYAGKEYEDPDDDCATSGTPVITVDQSPVCPQNGTCTTPRTCQCVNAFTLRKANVYLDHPLAPHIKLDMGSPATSKIFYTTWCKVIRPNGATKFVELLLVEYIHPKVGKIHAAVGAEINALPVDVDDSVIPRLSAEEHPLHPSLWIVKAGFEYRVIHVKE